MYSFGNKNKLQEITLNKLLVVCYVVTEKCHKQCDVGKKLIDDVRTSMLHHNIAIKF